MSGTADVPEFRAEDPPPQETSAASAAEQKAFEAPTPQPNSFLFMFGQWGHISWQSESSTAVLALIILTVLCLLTLVIVLVSVWSADKGWVSGLLQVLGHAIAGVAGAVIGASAATKSSNRRR